MVHERMSARERRQPRLLLCALGTALLAGGPGALWGQAVEWSGKTQTVQLARGSGLSLASGGAASAGGADLRLTAGSLVSQTGEIAVVPGRTLGAAEEVPGSGYRRSVPIDDLLSGVAVVRLPGGRYARVKLGSLREGVDGGGYTEVSLTYELSEASAAPAPSPSPAPQPQRPAPAPEGPGHGPGAAAARLDPRLIGRWNLRIPSGIGYSTDGTHVYQKITPGAELGVLTIRPDGSYTWEGIYWNRGGERVVRGQLAPADRVSNLSGEAPSWSVRDGKSGYRIFWSPDNRRPFTVIYPEGGVVASGERAGRS